MLAARRRGLCSSSLWCQTHSATAEASSGTGPGCTCMSTRWGSVLGLAARILGA